MKKRIQTACLIVAAILLSLKLLGPSGGILLLVLLSVGSQFEFYQLLQKSGAEPMWRFGIGLGILMLLSSYLIPTLGSNGSLALAMLILLPTLLFNQQVARSFCPTLLGVIYIPFMLQFYILCAIEYASLFPAIWIIMVAKCSDAGAYFVGQWLGRTPLAPTISPKKTLEGAIGGILASILVGCILATFFTPPNALGLNPANAIIIAAVLALVAIVSELVESSLKRWANIKESGNIAGLGGVLDIADSLLLTAPAGYLIFKYCLS